MLSIGILTHNSPITLENSFKSYKLSGLFDFTDDIFCLIQPSEKSDEEILICNNYGIKYILENNNTMMAGAIIKIVNQAKYEYILFLECDFRSCKNKKITYEILNFSIDNLKNHNFDIIRLRNLKKPGHPIHWNLQRDEGLNYDGNKQLYLCTHYLNNPHLVYPEYIKKVNDYQLLYEMNSKNCVYTNNANITSKKYYLSNILPYAIKNHHLEPELHNIWPSFNTKIGITSGIFKHIRIDGHCYLDGTKKLCYCCSSKYGGLSDNINCVCCILPYQPKYFEESDLENYIEDNVDEDEKNNIYPLLKKFYNTNS